MDENILLDSDCVVIIMYALSVAEQECVLGNSEAHHKLIRALGSKFPSLVWNHMDIECVKDALKE